VKCFFIFAMFLFVAGCGSDYTPEQEKYIEKIEKLREAKDEEFRTSPSSPFNARTKVPFHPLNYFDVDPGFVFESTLVEYEMKDTVKIFGTKGEERKAVRFGYLIFSYFKALYKLNVYQGTTRDGQVYYSIWFTDATTGEETYGVGRYIDFELNPNPQYIYTVDFNLAYNPYCAYSPDYSCAIPTKEDHLSIRITAGEKKFHD